MPGENKFSLEFLNCEERLDGILPLIVQSAIEILISEKELSRVKKCEGAPCVGCFWIQAAIAADVGVQWQTAGIVQKQSDFIIIKSNSLNMALC